MQRWSIDRNGQQVNHMDTEWEEPDLSVEFN